MSELPAKLWLLEPASTEEYTILYAIIQAFFAVITILSRLLLSKYADYLIALELLYYIFNLCQTFESRHIHSNYSHIHSMLYIFIRCSLLWNSAMIDNTIWLVPLLLEIVLFIQLWCTYLSYKLQNNPNNIDLQHHSGQMCWFNKTA
eukprot:308018_1